MSKLVEVGVHEIGAVFVFAHFNIVLHLGVGYLFSGGVELGFAVVILFLDCLLR
jgi:hypothetical protein